MYAFEDKQTECNCNINVMTTYYASSENLGKYNLVETILKETKKKKTAIENVGKLKLDFSITRVLSTIVWQYFFFIKKYMF